MQRTGPDTGRLVIFDHEHANELIHRQDVPLSYGVLFGPDPDDVQEWQAITLSVIDRG